MTASTFSSAKFSVFTLALLEDSGWYKANFSSAEPLIHGKERGCDFISKTCIDPSTKQPRFPEFCTSKLSRACSADNTATGYCVMKKAKNLFSAFDYFGNGMVGWDRFADGCPTRLVRNGSSCTDPESKAVGTRGPQSLCFEFMTDRKDAFRRTFCLEHEVLSNAQ